jgi:hypothetical protein
VVESIKKDQTFALIVKTSREAYVTEIKKQKNMA